MSDQFEKSISERMADAWAKLTLSQKEAVSDYADWLAHRSRFTGGPFDGLQIDEKFREYMTVSIQLSETKVAVYEWDDAGFLVYSSNYRIGGEGGRFPDINAKALREMGVTHDPN